MRLDPSIDGKVLLAPYRRCRRAIGNLCDRADGQTITEYALILAAIAVVLILALVSFGGKVEDLFTDDAQKSQPGTLKPPVAQCDPNYAACIPPPPPDLDCSDIQALGIPIPVRVIGSDPHGLDPDGDGYGCN